MGKETIMKKKRMTECMHCGLKAVRQIFKDELGEYIVCGGCSSSCDV